MDLTQNHAEIAWSHWTAQFGDSPRLEALVKALYQPANENQEALLALFEERWLDTAAGTQLDGIGQIVGQPRVIPQNFAFPFFGFEGQPAIERFGEARLRRQDEQTSGGSVELPDAEYRRLLYWKIAVNNGHGSAPELRKAVRPIFGASVVIINNVGNASFDLFLGGIADGDSPFLQNVESWIPKAAGVGINTVTTTPNLPFGFREQDLYGFEVGVFAEVI